METGQARTLATGMSVYGPKAREALQYDAHAEPVQPWQFGPGIVTNLFPAAPGAGNNFTRIVPGDLWEQPELIRFTLTTSAVVANRVPVVFAKPVANVGNLVGFEIPSQTQTATSTTRFNFLGGYPIPNFNGGGRVQTGFPLYLVPPGWEWGIQILTIDAGDTVFDIACSVRQWRNVPARAVRALAL